MEPREIKLNNYIESLELKTEHIFEEFKDFSDGCRMLILLERKKDGGHNKEERRTLQTRFSFSEEEFKRAIKELLVMRIIYPESRLYSSVNARSIKKVIRRIEEELLDCHYSDEERRLFTYKKLIKSARHFVMQQSASETSLFVIDADDVEGKDIHGEVLKHCAELGVEILKPYKTKNGWHVIVKPFNPSLWKHTSEIKKDALILLDF